MYFALGDNRKYFSADALYGVSTNTLKGALCYYFVDPRFSKTVTEILVENGKCVIMISSELPEIINMSDRVYTMYEGNLTGCISYEEGLTQEAIMKLATLETAGGNN